MTYDNIITSSYYFHNTTSFVHNSCILVVGKKTSRKYFLNNMRYNVHFYYDIVEEYVVPPSQNVYKKREKMKLKKEKK